MKMEKITTKTKIESSTESKKWGIYLKKEINSFVEIEKAPDGYYLKKESCWNFFTEEEKEKMKYWMPVDEKGIRKKALQKIKTWKGKITSEIFKKERDCLEFFELSAENTGDFFMWRGYKIILQEAENERTQEITIDNEKKEIIVCQSDNIEFPMKKDKGWLLQNSYTTEYAKSYQYANNETTLRKFVFQGDDDRMYMVDLFGSKKTPMAPFDEKCIAKLVRPAKFQSKKVIQQGDQLFTKVEDFSEKNCKKYRISHERKQIGLHVFEIPVLFSGSKIAIPEKTKLKHPTHPAIELESGIYEYGETLSFSNNGGTD